MKKKLLTSAVALSVLSAGQLPIPKNSVVPQALQGTMSKIADAAVLQADKVEVTGFTAKNSVTGNAIIGETPKTTFTVSMKLPDDVKNGDTLAVNINTPITRLSDGKVTTTSPFNVAITGTSDVVLADKGVVIGKLNGQTITFNSEAEKYIDKTISISLTSDISLFSKEAQNTKATENINWSVTLNNVVKETKSFETKVKDFSKPTTAYLTALNASSTGDLFIGHNTNLGTYLKAKGDVVYYKLILPNGLTNMDFQPKIKATSNQMYELTQEHPDKYYKSGAIDLDLSTELVKNSEGEIIIKATLNENLSDPNTHILLDGIRASVEDMSAFLNNNPKSGKVAEPFVSSFANETRTLYTREFDGYVVSGSVADADGSQNTAPTIESKDISIYVGDAFDAMKDLDPVATDKEDGDEIQKSVEVVSSNVDTSTPGEYTVEFKVTDSRGVVATSTSKVTVKEKENISPTLTSEDLSIYVDDAFDAIKDLKPTAFDEEDGDEIQKSVEVVSSNVDTSTPGEYTVEFKVTDSKGATATSTSKVTVKEKENTKPTVTAGDVIINVGDAFDPLVTPNPVAKDKEDGDISDKVEVVSSNVNNQVPGIYDVELKVTDKGGLSDTTRIKVVVNYVPKDGKDGIDGTNGVDGTSISITGTSKDDNGNTVITFSDGTKITLINGKDGKDGIDGTNGVDGKSMTVTDVVKDGNGNTVITFSDGTKITIPKGMDGKDGVDGKTPYIGENGNWWIGDEDTGIKATGKDGVDGKTPYIGENGNWWIDGKDTGKPSTGKDGVDGKDGKDGTNGVDGKTPYIGENGNWWIGDEDTGIKAAGKDGKDGTGNPSPIVINNNNTNTNSNTNSSDKHSDSKDGKDEVIVGNEEDKGDDSSEEIRKPDDASDDQKNDTAPKNEEKPGNVTETNNANTGENKNTEQSNIRKPDNANNSILPSTGQKSLDYLTYGGVMLLSITGAAYLIYRRRMKSE